LGSYEVEKLGVMMAISGLLAWKEAIFRLKGRPMQRDHYLLWCDGTTVLLLRL